MREFARVPMGGAPAYSGTGNLTGITVRMWHADSAGGTLSGDSAADADHVCTVVLTGEWSESLPGERKPHARPLTRGQFRVTEPNAAVHWRSLSPSAGLVQFALPEDLLQRVTTSTAVCRPGAITFRTGLGQTDPEIWRLARAAAAALAGASPSLPLVLDGIGLQLCARLTQRWRDGAQQAPEPIRGGLSPRRLRVATEFLEAHLVGRTCFDELAAQLGVSTKHLSRSFKQSTGVPMKQWVIARRIERAKSMISDGTESLADVALVCGFADQSHFTTAFRRAVGISPGRFRATMR